MSSYPVAARLVIRAIVSDMARGSVPMSVTTFSEIHDSVDANEYLLDAGCFSESFDDDAIAQANEIIEHVTGWLRLMAEKPNRTISDLIVSIPVDDDFS